MLRNVRNTIYEKLIYFELSNEGLTMPLPPFVNYFKVCLIVNEKWVKPRWTKNRQPRVYRCDSCTRREGTRESGTRILQLISLLENTDVITSVESRRRALRKYLSSASENISFPSAFSHLCQNVFSKGRRTIIIYFSRSRVNLLPSKGFARMST